MILVLLGQREQQEQLVLLVILVILGQREQWEQLVQRDLLAQLGTRDLQVRLERLDIQDPQAQSEQEAQWGILVRLV